MSRIDLMTHTLAALDPPNLRRYSNVPQADEPKADVLVQHRELERAPRTVVWVKDEPTCYACGNSATHEIRHRGTWLDVCDDPACTGRE